MPGQLLFVSANNEKAAPVYVGNSFGRGRVGQPRDRFVIGSDGTVELTQVYRDLYDGWLERALTRNAAHPTYTNLPLTGVSCQQLARPAVLCDVTLIFSLLRAKGIAATSQGGTIQPISTTGLGQLPPATIAENASTIEIPIESHERYAGLSLAELEAIHLALDTHQAPTGLSASGQELYNFMRRGTTSIVVGSVSRTETSYSWEQPASRSEDVGTLNGANWLIVSGEISQERGYWRQSKTMLYSKTPWPTVFYT